MTFSHSVPLYEPTSAINKTAAILILVGNENCDFNAVLLKHAVLFFFNQKCTRSFIGPNFARLTLR